MATSTSAVRGNRSWFPECIRFLNEICTKFDLDISNNRRIELFMEIVATNKVIVNEEMLDSLGYSGQYSEKEDAFARLLLENPKIKYHVILDVKDRNHKNYILNGIDFESLIMRLGTPKALELLLLISLIKSSSLTYYKHRDFYFKEQLRRTVDVLRNEIAPRVTPTPINNNKIHCLGQYRTFIVFFILTNTFIYLQVCLRLLYQRNGI